MTMEDSSQHSSPGAEHEHARDGAQKAETVGATSAEQSWSITQLPESRVPPGHLRSITFLLLGLLIIAVFFSLYYARAVFCPIVLALVLNFLLSPLVRFLNRLGIPNSFGAVVVLALTVTVVGFGAVQLMQPASHWLREAPTILSELEQELRALRRPVQQISEAGEKLEQATRAEPAEEADTVEVRMVTSSLSETVLSMTGTVIVDICVTLILLYFLLSAGDHLLNKVVEAVPLLHNKKTVVEIARDVEYGISRYLLSITIINTLLGVAIAVAMYLLGMPNPGLWGVMAALLNYVPYLGAITGTAIIALVALATLKPVASLVGK